MCFVLPILNMHCKFWLQTAWPALVRTSTHCNNGFFFFFLLISVLDIEWMSHNDSREVNKQGHFRIRDVSELMLDRKAASAEAFASSQTMIVFVLKPCFVCTIITTCTFESGPSFKCKIYLRVQCCILLQVMHLQRNKVQSQEDLGVKWAWKRFAIDFLISSDYTGLIHVPLSNTKEVLMKWLITLLLCRSLCLLQSVAHRWPNRKCSVFLEPSRDPCQSAATCLNKHQIPPPPCFFVSNCSPLCRFSQLLLQCFPNLETSCFSSSISPSLTPQGWQQTFFNTLSPPYLLMCDLVLLL